MLGAGPTARSYLGPPEVCTHLSLVPSPTASMPREAGTRTPPMSHRDANPAEKEQNKGEEGRREREENPQSPHLSPPVQSPVQSVMGGRLGGAQSSAWPWSGPNLRPALSLSLVGESSFAVHPWADSVYPRHWNPQDLELTMDVKRQRQPPPGAQNHC